MDLSKFGSSDIEQPAHLRSEHAELDGPYDRRNTYGAVLASFSRRPAR
jgi:hypothetical protein